MADRNDNGTGTIFDVFTDAIGRKIESLKLWQKQLQMILISLYILISSIVTFIQHTTNFRNQSPYNYIDVAVIIVMVILIIINTLFIYGCFTNNKYLLYLTPAIPNFITIFAVFPQFHAFYYPLKSFLEEKGLTDSIFNYILNNLGTFTSFRIIFYIPILVYGRFLFNIYMDDFVKEREEELKKLREEYEENMKKVNEANETNENEEEKKDENGEKKEEEKEVNEDNNEVEEDPEAKKNN